MGSHYSPLSSRGTTPRNNLPMTPRTRAARIAWWLALASIVVSTTGLLIIFTAQPYASLNRNGGQYVHRVVLKSFLLTPENSKLLYQSKPLLVEEEELDAIDIRYLHQDQESKEAAALDGLQDAERERTAVVRHLITEYLTAKPVSDAQLERLQGWAPAELLTEEEKDDFPEEMGYDGDYDGGIAVFGSEDQGGGGGGEEEEWEEGDVELVGSLAEEAVEQAAAAAFAAAQGSSAATAEKEEGKETALVGAAVGVWSTGRGNADDVDLDASAPVEEAPRPGPEAPFLEALSTCRSLACLREAHARTRLPGQFNFPHALIIGWQKSATTSLYEHLKRHKQVLESATKEPEFFTAHCRGDPAACPPSLEAHYVQSTLRRDEMVGEGGALMAFEASTHYAMNGDPLAARVAAALPWVKIVASLREPISRAASMLIHLKDRDGEGCLAAPGADLYTCLATASQLTGCPGPDNHLDSPHGGYARALGAWLAAFPAGRVHVVQYEALVDDDSSKEALRGVKSFLGVDPELPGGRQALDAHNIRKDHVNPGGWRMRRDHYQALVDMVAPDVESVLALLESHGLGERTTWLAGWQRVWDDNLKTCGADGWCMVQLS